MARELADDPDDVTVIATGGLAPMVLGESSVIDEHEPWLTLIGLRLVYERNVSRTLRRGAASSRPAQPAGRCRRGPPSRSSPRPRQGAASEAAGPHASTPRTRAAPGRTRVARRATPSSCLFCLISAYRRRMPTPYGSRGGMAFGAEELRVLRRALALALHPSPASAEDVQDCLRLAESVDEAAREGARLRAFLLADLARYRAALPGTVAGYLALLEEALDAGYRPRPGRPRRPRAPCAATPPPPPCCDRCRTSPSWTYAPASPPRPSDASRPPRSGPAVRPAHRAPRPARAAARPKARDGSRPGRPHPARRKPSPRRPATPRARTAPVPTPGEVFPPQAASTAPRPPREPAPAAGTPVPAALATLDAWTTSPRSCPPS